MATTQQLIQWKQQGRSIVALTAWDYAIALEQAGLRPLKSENLAVYN